MPFLLSFALWLAQYAIPLQASAIASGTGNTIAAASCSQADVQTALSAATSTTTAITIPAGTCDWTGNISWSVPSGSAALSIFGAGNLTVVGGGDATVIVDHDTTDSNWLWQIVTGASSSYFRFAGITLQAGTGLEKQNGMLQFDGFSQHVRFDHCHMNQSPSSSGEEVTLRILNWEYGVADHILGNGFTGIEIYLDEYGNSAANFGDNSWADATNFGSGDAFFIEASQFTGGPATGGQYANYIGDCYQGGRQVIRYNTLTNNGVDEHPTGGAERWRGCRSTEIYHNTFTASNTTPQFTGFFDSAAGLLMYSNSAPTGIESMVWLVSARNGYDYTQVATPNGWGYCSATPIGGIDGPSNWDQNSGGANGYACLDQAGRGIGQLLNGIGFPGALNSVTGTIAWPNEALEPMYVFLNTWAQVPAYPRTIVTLADSTHDSTTFIQNRDWYQDASPFTGAAGVGSGLFSARPSTCVPLVAYWATDQDTLYQCTATNTWTSYYTPYTYPHPLDH